MYHILEKGTATINGIYIFHLISDLKLCHAFETKLICIPERNLTVNAWPHLTNNQIKSFLTGPTVSFMDEIESIQAEVNNLKQQGINKIIAVGHAGYVKDQEIARRVDGLDIVVGGHTDTFLYTGKNISQWPRI